MRRALGRFSWPVAPGTERTLEEGRVPRQRQTRGMKCSIAALCCKYRCCNTANNLPPFTDFTRRTGDPVCSRNKDYIRELKELFSLYPSVTNTHTHGHSRDGYSLCTCVSWPSQREDPFYFQSYLLQLSWCKDALSSEAREECSSAISLSLCPISLAHCLPLSAATEMSAFVLLSIPPSLSLYCLSALTLLPPFLPPCATAPQQSHLHCLHLSHMYISYITSLKTRQNLGILCLSKVQKEKKKVQNKKVHIYLAIKLPSNLLCEHSSISSAQRVYFGATSTTVKLSWRHF